MRAWSAPRACRFVLLAPQAHALAGKALVHSRSDASRDHVGHAFVYQHRRDGPVPARRGDRIRHDPPRLDAVALEAHYRERRRTPEMSGSLDVEVLSRFTRDGHEPHEARPGPARPDRGGRGTLGLGVGRVFERPSVNRTGKPLDFGRGALPAVVAHVYSPPSFASPARSASGSTCADSAAAGSTPAGSAVSATFSSAV